MKTYLIHLQGQVQGVGFRPFVYQLATQMGLTGWVSNTVAGVEIVFRADAATAATFYDRVREEAPPRARIVHHDCRTVAPAHFADFRIADSAQAGTPTLFISPDFAVCADCRRELQDPPNRRHGYAFITCTQCGPRYSVLTALPYDRDRTTMAPFAPCALCAAEYADVGDRRYHSQTNSCADCGVSLRALRPDGTALATDPVNTALTTLRAGGVVAVKGVGGFVLLTDARRATAVAELRRRKQRPRKPFALLYPEVAAVRRDLVVTPAAERWLTDPIAPIVLLPRRPGACVVAESVAPGLDCLGAMLPSAPLLLLLAEGFGGPLVATSGNRSGQPIARTAAEIGELADLILDHNREITFPQDDSVLQLSPMGERPIWLRRGRGLAPAFFSSLRPEGSGLAVGAMLKSTFTIWQQGQLYVSQYLGDTADFDVQQRYEAVLARLCDLLRLQPDCVLRDLHPQYPTSVWAEAQGVPAHAVPHHEAHLLAVLAEHDLLDTPAPVLGVIWDGTGLGPDGHFWGGEFFDYAAGRTTRVAHVGEYPQLPGDQMARAPRLSALALSTEATMAWLRPHFTAPEWENYATLRQQTTRRTTSVGRWFDAVAFVLGFPATSSYEGEAALFVEQLALRYAATHGWADVPNYLPAHWQPGLPTAAHVFAAVVRDRVQGHEAGEIAVRFHATLVALVRAVAAHTGHTHLAFGGGVFQNGLLVDMLTEQLSATHQLYFHEQLPPNDECISLGQWAWHHVGAVVNKTYHPQNTAARPVFS